ncbi:MAG: hypothetical protein GXP31_10985 [Kiritimatiellaeota bacterium]|nr:hypothetical protein [Kiritimatiellota bacterium]
MLKQRMSSFLVLAAVLGSALSWAPPAVRSLTEFGDLSNAGAAQLALERAVKELMAEGGGVVTVPPGAPAELSIRNMSQTDRKGPGVTIIDYRDGFVAYHLAPIGKHQTGTWAGMRLDRILNLAPNSLPHCGTQANEAIQNYIVSGATSYMATLKGPVTAGNDRRCYVDTIRGIWVGQFLTVTSSVMGYAPPYDRIRVKSIGWDKQRRENYFVADFKYDHPAGVLVYNKHVVNSLEIDGFSNCDNQSMELNVRRNQYAVGDSFVISGVLKYMSDVFSGFGDEGGIVLNAETVGVLDSFRSTVAAVNWKVDELTYAPGKVNAHSLSNSRPLINMNRAKWVTRGRVFIVPPDKEYRGLRNPSVIGGPGNVFNYQGGLILGTPDCTWNADIVGRFFAVIEPTETILPNDPSTAGGYAKLPDRPIYRWYCIKQFKRLSNGMKQLKILRVRWSAVAAGAPKLFLDENYTWDGHERPLRYAIAPGAWVYDISRGWADSIPTGGFVDKKHPRRLKVTPTGDRGTKYDFEAGDPIEQAVGADPWQPRPLRIRQFDQLPTTMDNAAIEVQQMGRVQVPYCLSLTGIITSRKELARRKDGKPPYRTIMRIRSLADVGLDFESEVLDAAIIFRQPNDLPQPIRWRNNVTGSSSLVVEPGTGNFVLQGGDIDVSGKAVKRVRGLSATGTPAANLRGIDIGVKQGADRVQVVFSTPEQDAHYAVSITPSWMTNLCVPEKTATGFAVQFAVPAPKKARMDWVLVR